MASHDSEDSRIRDGVRDSKIRSDILWDSRQKLASFTVELNQAEIGRNYNLVEHDSFCSTRVVPRVTMREVNGTGFTRGGHYPLTPGEERRRIVLEANKRWGSCTGYFKTDRSLFEQQTKMGYTVTRSRTSNFDEDVPTFNGSSCREDFWEWIDTIEDYFEETNPPEHIYCKLATFKLEGDAYTWWNKLQHDRDGRGKEKITSWFRMKKLLFRKFLSTTCSTKVPIESYSSKHNAASELEIPDAFEVMHEEADIEILKQSTSEKPLIEGTKGYIQLEVGSQLVDVGDRHGDKKDDEATTLAMDADSCMIDVPQKEILIDQLPTENEHQLEEFQKVSNDTYTEDERKIEQILGERADFGMAEEFIREVPFVQLSNMIEYQVNEVLEAKGSTKNVQEGFNVTLSESEHITIYTSGTQLSIGATILPPLGKKEPGTAIVMPKNVNVQEKMLAITKLVSFLFDPGGMWKNEKNGKIGPNVMEIQRILECPVLEKFHESARDIWTSQFGFTQSLYLKGCWSSTNVGVESIWESVGSKKLTAQFLLLPTMFTASFNGDVFLFDPGGSPLPHEIGNDLFPNYELFYLHVLQAKGDDENKYLDDRKNAIHQILGSFHACWDASVVSNIGMPQKYFGEVGDLPVEIVAEYWNELEEGATGLKHEICANYCFLKVILHPLAPKAFRSEILRRCWLGDAHVKGDRVDLWWPRSNVVLTTFLATISVALDQVIKGLTCEILQWYICRRKAWLPTTTGMISLWGLYDFSAKEKHPDMSHMTALFYSSSTTRTSKGMVYSHRNFISDAFLVGLYFVRFFTRKNTPSYFTFVVFGDFIITWFVMHKCWNMSNWMARMFSNWFRKEMVRSMVFSIVVPSLALQLPIFELLTEYLKCFRLIFMEEGNEKQKLNSLLSQLPTVKYFYECFEGENDDSFPYIIYFKPFCLVSISLFQTRLCFVGSHFTSVHKVAAVASSYLLGTLGKKGGFKDNHHDAILVINKMKGFTCNIMAEVDEVLHDDGTIKRSDIDGKLVFGMGPWCNLQINTVLNLTRGRLIQWEGWNDENNSNTEERFIVAKLMGVTVFSCTSIICKNGQVRETSKMFCKLVNGVDPPMDLNDMFVKPRFIQVRTWASFRKKGRWNDVGHLFSQWAFNLA